jgi:hypothetical protein
MHQEHPRRSSLAVASDSHPMRILTTDELAAIEAETQAEAHSHFF